MVNAEMKFKKVHIPSIHLIKISWFFSYNQTFKEHLKNTYKETVAIWQMLEIFHSNSTSKEIIFLHEI